MRPSFPMKIYKFVMLEFYPQAETRTRVNYNIAECVYLLKVVKLHICRVKFKASKCGNANIAVQ